MSFKTQAWFVAGGLLALGAVVVLYQMRSPPRLAPVQVHIPDEPAPVLSAKPQSPAGEFHLPIDELVARRDQIVPDRVMPKDFEPLTPRPPVAQSEPVGIALAKAEEPARPTLEPPLPENRPPQRTADLTLPSSPTPGVPEVKGQFTDSPTPCPPSPLPHGTPPAADTLPAPVPPVAPPLESATPERLRPETAPPPFPVPPSALSGAMPTPADLTVNRTDRPRKRSEKPCPLTGMHSCKTDDKNGLCLPETVDRALGQPDQLFVAPGANGELIVANTDGIEQMKARETYPTTKGSDDSAVLRHFFSLWERVDVDTTGYVVIPEKLRAVGRPTEMVFVGVGDHFELWTAKAWKDYKNAQMLWRTCIDPFSECRQTGVVTTPPPSGF
jgi:DNA-binding transcriptional regulator/RsmH inhibitor MraZ